MVVSVWLAVIGISWCRMSANIEEFRLWACIVFSRGLLTPFPFCRVIMQVWWFYSHAHSIFECWVLMYTRLPKWQATWKRALLPSILHSCFALSKSVQEKNWILQFAWWKGQLLPGHWNIQLFRFWALVTVVVFRVSSEWSFSEFLWKRNTKRTGSLGSNIKIILSNKQPQLCVWAWIQAFELDNQPWNVFVRPTGILSARGSVWDVSIQSLVKNNLFSKLYLNCTQRRSLRAVSFTSIDNIFTFLCKMTANHVEMT